MAEVGHKREVLHNDQGTPRVSATKAEAMEPVLALRPELDSSSFAAGYAIYGPFSNDIHQESRTNGAPLLPEKSGAL